MKLLLLLMLFQVKHFVADFPLQNVYMLGKFKPNWDFVLPLGAHSGVHALFTLILAICFTSSIKLIAFLALLDFVSHFLIDRIKASPNLLGRFKNIMKPAFWNCLGLDQMLHGLVYSVMIYLLMNQ